MCEVCRDPRLEEERRERIISTGATHDPPSLEPPGDDEDVYMCEYHVKGQPSLCGATADWVVRFIFVEDHLCDAHRVRVAEDLDGGLREIFQVAGLGGDETVVAIKEKAKCEWTPDLPPFRECGKPARWAHITAGQMLFCDEHLKANDAEERRRRQRRVAKRVRVPPTS
ncbi:MAG: hypothetical protein JRM86_03140 [Nitrososphaerota archaeon]|nr:hypothetical protein [Nitrososphaerota archaeon]